MRELDPNGIDGGGGVELLTGILRAADRHPNSRVSKLIRCVEEERSQKNIVLLLIELAENAEYATDFGISLKYYLDLFVTLGIGQDIVLNEAGLLLLNSSKVYARRVDFVQELVERQILTLSNADREIAEAKKNEEQAPRNAEKPKRSRKRLVEAPSDPYEVELVPRKFRKLTEDKRFAITRPNVKTQKPPHRNVDTEQYIHPAAWTYAHIVDLENEEEVDSKRNYKLFTYQVEHRYNTLVPDINFRLHFKVKDYIDEEEERLEEKSKESGDCVISNNDQEWPPLSEEYVTKYLHLEDKALVEELMPQRKRCKIEQKTETRAVGRQNEINCLEDGEVAALETVQNSNLAEALAAECSKSANSEARSTNNNESLENDTGLGESLLGTTNADVSTKSIADDTDNTAADSHEKSGTEDHNTSGTTALNLEQVQSSDAVQNSLLDSSKESGTDSGNNSTVLSTLDNSKSQDDSSITENSMEKSALSEDLPQNDSGMGESINEQDPSCCSQNISCSSNAGNSKEIGNISAVENVEDGKSADGEDAQVLKCGKEGNSGDNAEALNKSDSSTEAANQDNVNRVEHDGIKDKTESEDVSSRKPMEYEDKKINFGEIRVHLPHMDDEGVYFSDLDEQDHRMLSPTVVATDVFPSIPNKKNITIIVDDEIKALLNLPDEEPETYVLPVEKRHATAPIVLNILKIHEKFLKRRVLFKLGPDMEIFLQARSMKRVRGAESDKSLQRVMKWFPLSNTDMTGVNITPLPSPGHESELDFCGFSEIDESQDFLGFTEEEQAEKGAHRLSRDSGVGADAPLTPPVKCSLTTITEELNNATKKNAEELATELAAKEGSAAVERMNDDNTQATIDDESIQQSTESVQECVKSSEILPEENENCKDVETDETVTNTKEVEISDNIADTCTSYVLDTTMDVNTAPDDELPLECAKTKERSSELDDHFTDIELNSSKTKIQKWHEHLQPILAKSRERHHFDVFQIGTEIIDELRRPSENEISTTIRTSPKSITFQDVMNNKDESYVSRYFLSSLLLANQNNIKITVNNKSTESPSAWSDIHFELLSTKRHTVAIEDNIGMISAKAPATQRLAQVTTDHPNSSSTSAEAKSVNWNAEQENSRSKSFTLDSDILNVNLNVVRPLKHIEKLPNNSDDYDSGVFSNEECPA